MSHKLWFADLLSKFLTIDAIEASIAEFTKTVEELDYDVFCLCQQFLYTLFLFN